MIEEFVKILTERVLVLDGAMGTMIQRLNLTEEDYRGRRFREAPGRLKGNNDMLSLTCPDAIAGIHRAYIDAGADIISTNSFNANAISMADYGLEAHVGEMNRAAAAIARGEADRCLALTGRRVWVAGSVGPTNRAASMSPDVADAALRNVTFDRLSEAYREQIEGLAVGGADLVLIETVFDTLNMKAALDGAAQAFEHIGRVMPVMISATIADRGGHTLSGQTLDAFVASVGWRPYVVSLGLNCSFGPEELVPHIEHLGDIAPYFLSCHPNAGLPDALGDYRETPQSFARSLGPLLRRGRLNIAGGCCGTTPEHIRELAAEASSGEARPRLRPSRPDSLILSGLEALDCGAKEFVVVGERCNVAGSRKFLRLVGEGNFDEAIRIAAAQIDAGAMVIDINMDDAMLDAPEAMTRMLNIISCDAAVGRVPVMIDSSDWEVVERALKCCQGRAVVNSISLKEGEAEFLRKARRIRSLGAAVVVMAFDEEGQATTFERRRDICARAYRLLTTQAGFEGHDIIFDPNIMAIATGIADHDRYALDFIRATRWIKENLPGALVSGGVSNLSFAFRGNNPLREAMHCVFLHHARRAGMDMAIVNPSTLCSYDDIEPHLRQLLDDAILAREAMASERLAEYALGPEGTQAKNRPAPVVQANLRDKMPLGDRLRHAIINGTDDWIESDLKEALGQGMSAADIIRGPLMSGMEEVGRLFGEGTMFLPQVVKTARTMKEAVEILRPHMPTASGAGATASGRILFATVKGDVHDIGKNIVSIVLECNNYEVVDLGVMVAPEKIVSEARRLRPDIIALSGLITPSLGEMVTVAEALQQAGLRIPLMVGGAATSEVHTALKIAPVYDAPVIHARDASQNPVIAGRLLNQQLRPAYEADLRQRQELLRAAQTGKTELLPWSDASDKGLALNLSYSPPEPASEISTPIFRELTMAEVVPLINWPFLFMAWRMSDRIMATFPYGATTRESFGQWVESAGAPRGKAEELVKLYMDANALLGTIAPSAVIARGVVRFEKANSEENDIAGPGWRLPMLRNQRPDSKGQCLSTADFLLPRSTGRTDYMGFFCVSVNGDLLMEGAGDQYTRLLWQSLADRLAEAASERLHQLVRTRLWGYSPDEHLSPGDLLRERYRGIRPAVGYPALPDQLMMHRMADFLPLEELGVSVTENGAMKPSSTVCGLYFANPQARYFTISLDEPQLADYGRRCNIKAERLNSALLSVVKS